MTNQTPSQNPANMDSMVGMFREVLQKFLQGVDDMLPARVVAYDRATNRATVQPLIRILTTGGELVSRAQISSVPVFQIGGGNFMLNFPLNPGDLGWVKANDRDISKYLQGYTETGPNTLRKHSFEDAIFFPQIMTGYTIEGEDNANVVLSSKDGSQRVAIWPGKVKITSDSTVVIDAPLTECTGQLITGTNPAYPQLATFNGNIRVTGDVVGEYGTGDISLNTHVHSGVQPGGGNTGQPV